MFSSLLCFFPLSHHDFWSYYFQLTVYEANWETALLWFKDRAGICPLLIQPCLHFEYVLHVRCGPLCRSDTVQWFKVAGGHCWTTYYLESEYTWNFGTPRLTEYKTTCSIYLLNIISNSPVGIQMILKTLMEKKVNTFSGKSANGNSEVSQFPKQTPNLSERQI